ncbi:MAG: phage tail tape measure protein, partial [Gammaproteobacteria bacterium]|nr:phage tail tape measure protein [Gammaproteobacteria bacterium]
MAKNILLKVSLKGAKKATGGLVKVGGAIKSLSKVSGVAGVAIAGLSVKLAGDFSKSLAEVSTLMGSMTEKEMKRMSKELRVLSQTSGLALSSLSKAKYDIVSAGFASAAESAQVLAASSKLAVGGVTSAAAAADIITTSLNSYNLSSEKANEISDSLFTTVRLGKTTMDELSFSLGNVLPVAKSAGLSFDSVGAAMASLTANGIDTAVSTTALRGAIVALTAPTDGARIAMESAGIEAKRFDDGTFDLLETVKQFEGLSPDLLRQYIPDIRATIAISSLANNIDGLSDNLDAFANKTGATSKAFDIMAAEFNTQMAMLKNTTQSIMIEIGSVIIDAILPSITEANGELAKLGDIGWDVVAKRIVDGSGHIRLILKDVMDIIGQEMFIGGQRALARLPRLLGGISDKEMENNIAVAEQLISSKVRVMMIEIDALHQKISEPVAIDTTEWFTPTEMGFDNT